MSYKNYKLFLRSPNRRWLGNIRNVFRDQWDKLECDVEFNDIRTYSPDQVIVMEKFQTHNLKSIPIKYTRIIKELLRIYECKAIYNKEMVYNEVFVTIEVFGYEPDVILCLNMIEYIVTGSQKARESIQRELRNKKLNARRRGGKLTVEHSKTISTDFLNARLLQLEEFFKEFPVIHSEGNDDKQTQIFKKIDSWRNIDFKKYRNRSKATIYSSTAALGTIHINRLV